MSKTCKKRVHGNDKKNLPWDFKKCTEAQIDAEIMFSIPMLSSVHSDLLAFCGVFIIWVFKLNAITLWKSDIPVIGTNIFLGFSIVNDRPMQLGIPLKHIGLFIKFSRLKQSVKCCRFL